MTTCNNNFDFASLESKQSPHIATPHSPMRIFHTKNSNVIFIVLTGGPCGGKSTLSAELVEDLEILGWKAIVCNEVATELILSGIRPWEIPTRDFQSYVFQRMFVKEETSASAANFLGDKVVVICDRALPDNLAYMPEEMYAELLEEYDLTPVTVLERYHTVVHLVTAAYGAVEHYTVENNEARSEKPTEEGLNLARKLDDACMDAYTGHPDFHIIPNRKGQSFKSKIAMAKACIFQSLGIKETNKKVFLVKHPSYEELQNHISGSEVEIVYNFIRSTDPSIKRRITKRGNGTACVYYYAELYANDFSLKLERQISFDEYSMHLMDRETVLPVKRICFTNEYDYCSLERLPHMKDVGILTVNSSSEEITLPDWVEVVEDISHNPAFAIANLAF